jgi:gluconokinase
MIPIVIMGVAGCGKSSLAAAVARAHALPWVEGDDHHGEHNRKKMQRGIALTDADREGWLDTLGTLLTQYERGVVMSCSALKRAYRARLRQAAPDVRFVFLEIPPAQALERVAARPEHFFSTSLVDNQFATLESPVGERGVLRLDALTPLSSLVNAVNEWLNREQETV